MSSLLGLYGVLGITFIAELVAPTILGAIFVIVVVASRSEPDPSGRRAISVFMLVTSFVTLFIALFSSVVTVGALASLIGHRTGHGTSTHPVGDQVARIVVISVLVGVAAGAAFAVHLPRALAAARSEAAASASPAGPIGRVWQSYTAVVSFVCVLLAVAASAVAVYQLFRLAGPGIFDPGSSSRSGALRVLVPSGYLLVAALAVMISQQRRVILPPPLPAPTETADSLGSAGPESPGPNPYGPAAEE